MSRALGQSGILLATGILSFVLPAVGCSREISVPPISDAATVAALTPCPDAKPELGLRCGRLSVPEDRSPAGRPAYRAERDGFSGVGYYVNRIRCSSLPAVPENRRHVRLLCGPGCRWSAIVTSCSSTSAARAGPTPLL